METIKQYIITLVCASVVCALALKIIDPKSVSGNLIKLLCGVFLSVCAVSVFLDFDISEYKYLIPTFSESSQAVVSSGTDLADEQLRRRIKEQTETYILDKATSMETDLLVEVTLSDDEIPIPESIEITGSISPYAKIRMMEFLVNDLGISKERQVWIQ